MDGSRDIGRVWDYQMQTIICRMDYQQGPTVTAQNYIQYPVINDNGKEYEKIHICITETL